MTTGRGNRWLGGLLVAGQCVGCARSGPPAGTQVAIHLVDLFEDQSVQGAVKLTAAPPRTEWRFDGPPPSPAAEKFAATRGFEAGPGVASLAIRDGRLEGRTTTAFPLLRIERTSGLDNHDQLHSVEIRLRVSAGANLSIETAQQPQLDLADALKMAQGLKWEISTPLTPGGEARTYTLTKPRPLPASQIRHLLIRPTDVAGASFAIESVRLIFRQEHLASVPSGVGWQGMKEIYRESLVSRAPETLEFELSVPSQATLDLAVGIIDDVPVTFRVTASPATGSGASTAIPLLERTVTTAFRWETEPIDLARLAGQSVKLALSLRSDQAGAIGVWGSPVVRRRGVMPVAAAQAPDRGLAGVPQGVILIWADTLRRDHLNVYGYARETAPALAQMARQGTLFRNSTSQASWTKVSTPSLLTSLYPTSHGVLDFPDRLPASPMTLAEVYRAAGYATLGFASNLFTGQFTGLHQGYEVQHEDGSLSNPSSSKTSREYVDRLVTWLADHRDVPFFVFLHVYDPHDPYEPNRPYNTIWADPAKKDQHEHQSREVRKVIKNPLARIFGMPSRAELLEAGFEPEAYVGHDRDWYDGSIRGMDAEIGRLLERLRAIGLDDKTLVVFTADHGEEFLEHGHMFHGQTVYGDQTQVPLIVRWPGVVPAGAVVSEVTQTIDVMPTLLDISRLPHPKGLQGQSLVPLLRPRAAAGAEAVPASWKRRPAISEKAVTTSGFGAPWPEDTESYAIVDQGWKLVHNTRRPRGGPEFELYDTERDPLNLADVAAQHPDTVGRLAKALDGWKQMAAAARLKPDTETTKGLSQEQLERLRSLGYIK